MNQNYKSNMSSHYEKKLNPIEEEVLKNLGTFNLKVTIEKDLDMIREFKHIENFIAFKTTLRNENNEVIGIGTGTGVINRLNKFIERTCIFCKNASLIDAMVKSIKIIDALSIMPNNQNQKGNEVDLEGRDKQIFFSEEDLPQVATEKQLNFAKKLIENCDDDEKEQYLEQISSPYFSKFQCSELIQKLMPVK